MRGHLGAAACQSVDEGVDAAVGVGGARLDAAAGQGGHFNLLTRLYPEMAEQFLAERDLALGRDGEGGHGAASRNIYSS
jgi:hypothetical protein